MPPRLFASPIPLGRLFRSRNIRITPSCIPTFSFSTTPATRQDEKQPPSNDDAPPSTPGRADDGGLMATTLLDSVNQFAQQTSPPAAAGNTGGGNNNSSGNGGNNNSSNYPNSQINTQPYNTQPSSNYNQNYGIYPQSPSYNYTSYNTPTPTYTNNTQPSSNYNPNYGIYPQNPSYNYTSYNTPTPTYTNNTPGNPSGGRSTAAATEVATGTTPLTDADTEELYRLQRRFRHGEMYTPKDLSFESFRHWRKRRAPHKDAFDVLGLNPMVEYKNFNLLGEYVTDMGRIKPRTETGLRPVNQRKIAKAIRRAVGIGLFPSTHRHPEMLKKSEDSFFARLKVQRQGGYGSR